MSLEVRQLKKCEFFLGKSTPHIAAAGNLTYRILAVIAAATWTTNGRHAKAKIRPLNNHRNAYSRV
jgi:hypothetical protein